MARGSLSEVLNHLIDARDCGYIDDFELVRLQKEWGDLRRLLTGYMKYVKSRAGDDRGSTSESVSEPESLYHVEIRRSDVDDAADDADTFLDTLNRDV